METAPPRTTVGGPLRRFLPDAVILVVLLLLTLKFSYDIGKVRDLGTDDETYYLANAHCVSTWGMPKACYSPMYVLWYRGWDLFHLDLGFVYFANWGLLTFLLVASQYVLVRALGAFRLVALAFAFLTLTSGVVDIWPYVMHLTVFTLTMGVVIAARWRSWPGSLFTIGVTLALTAYLRPEFMISFLLFCPIALVCAVWVAFKRRELRWRLLLSLVMVSAIAGGLWAYFGNPLAGSRSFLAFGQHYSLNLWAQHRVVMDPWSNWEALTRADFGSAESIPAAARNNPQAFLWHISCNFSYLARNAKLLATSQLFYGRVTGPLLTYYLELLLSVVCAVGVVGLLLRLFRPSLAALPANRSLRLAIVLLLLVLAPSVASLVFIWPREHYLLPVLTFSGALSFAGFFGFPRLVERLRWLESWQALGAFVVLLALITPNQAHPWSVQQRLSRSGAKRIDTPPVLEVQRTVAAMRKIGVHTSRPIAVLESDFSRAFYAGWDSYKVDHWTKNEGFWEFVAARDIAAIVLNERLLTDTRFHDDPAFQEFAQEKTVRNFRFFEVPGTKVRIAVREDLLPNAVAGTRAP